MSPARLVLRLLLLALLCASSCTKRNPGYCDQELSCFDPQRPFCDLNGTFGDSGTNACIANPFGGCIADAECPSSAPFCDEAAGGCRPCVFGQGGDNECAALDASSPMCSAAGECVACFQDSDCPSASPFCERGQCSACAELGMRSELCEERDSQMPFCSERGQCAACVDSSACTGATPVCDIEGGVCRSCQEHEECQSGVCNRDSGECIAETDVFYMVASGGGGTACTRNNPCEGLQSNAIDAASGTRNWLKLADGIYDENLFIDNTDLRFIGSPSSILSSNTSFDTVEIDGDSEVLFDGLRIADASASGVLCSDSAQGRPRLVIRRTRINNNAGLALNSFDCDVEITNSLVLENRAGGINFAASNFTMRNSYVIRNGSPGSEGSSIGGIQINNNGLSQPLMQRIEFTTIADNRVQNTNEWTGIGCLGTLQPSIDSSILYFGTDGISRFTGPCVFTYSIVEGGALGPGNLSSDPEFANLGTGNFQLSPSSPAIDAANPGASETRDFHGDPRPQGDGYDIGADEHVVN